MTSTSCLVRILPTEYNNGSSCLAFKTNTCKIADMEFDGMREGMKILLFKDSSINGFCERIRAITNASFTVGCLKEEDDEQSAVLQISKNHCSVYFM